MKRRNPARSKNGKRNGQTQKKKPLGDQSEKIKGYTRDFLAYPKEYDFTERVKLMIEEHGISKSLVYRYARDFSWKELLDEQLMEDEHKTTVESMRDEIVTFRMDASFSDIADLLKKNATFITAINYGRLKHGLLMMNYYSHQIETILVAAGGVMNIAPEDKMQIEFYEKKINQYQAVLKDTISPAAAMSVYKAIGIHDEIAGLGSEESEGLKLTPDFILRKMEELGAKSSFEKESEADRMVAEVHRQQAFDTIVDGRLLKDTQISAREEKELKKKEQEKDDKTD